MPREHSAIFALAARLCELRADWEDAARILKDITDEITGTEQRLAEFIEPNKDWLNALVGVYKKHTKNSGRR